MVRALLALTPSGIMSMMSFMTAARSSRSKWLSMRCFVTVFAMPCRWPACNEICAAAMFTVPRRLLAHQVSAALAAEGHAGNVRRWQSPAGLLG